MRGRNNEDSFPRRQVDLFDLFAFRPFWVSTPFLSTFDFPSTFQYIFVLYLSTPPRFATTPISSTPLREIGFGLVAAFILSNPRPPWFFVLRLRRAFTSFDPLVLGFGLAHLRHHGPTSFDPSASVNLGLFFPFTF
ncbi:unnamed protein product [Cyclocybe aegerita]|uniref:Uncharacterized protein n=1 Tax=Cyclocybe aegerita TaxID=1973307 RepID=A0A8S0VR45_CYCAE|nr:unnamed protein product [Cyclocybe aegerita]